MSDEKKGQTADKTAALLAGIWQRNLPLLRERLEALRHAAALARSGALSREISEEAAATAHKLAGSLGMFGHHEGTRLAREIEQMLVPHHVPDPQHLSRLVDDLCRSLPV